MDSHDEANGGSGRGQQFASTPAAGCGCLGSSPSSSIAGAATLAANKTSAGTSLRLSPLDCLCDAMISATPIIHTW
jgi:hypothetical protein